MTSFWASIPDTGIATVLLVVGFLFFDHTSTVDWKNTKEALPTFTTCIMTAFTCSVLNGAVIGTLMYVLLTITTDYTDNVTETLMKGVFRGWNWAWDCWSASDGGEEDVVECHESEEGERSGAATTLLLKSNDTNSPDYTCSHNGETYYQSSS